MTQRQPLGLSAEQKQLRQQRALALERLANPTPTAPADSGATPAARPPRPEPRSQPRFEPRSPASGPARGNPRAEGGERFDSPVRDHRGARPLNEVARPNPTSARPAPAGGAERAPTAARRVVVAAAATDGSEGTRLNKRMAELRMCSRREGDAWIEQGWVTVNGVVAEMGQLVQPTDRIEVSEQAKDQQGQQVTILLHKPMGFVSGQAEDGHQPAVTLINPRTRWQHDASRTRFNFSQLLGLAPAGRLDIDSVGLLVLTQDGRVARQLIGEDSEMEKEYLVRVTCTAPDGSDIATRVQDVFPADQLARLRHGLSLDGEPLKPAKVEWENREQLRFVLTQGKKRQIRRMCEQVGLKVVGLKRIRMGRITLGNLPAGQWRYLLPTESF
jgi:23S rRNA pseudouridine2604 synthase